MEICNCLWFFSHRTSLSQDQWPWLGCTCSSGFFIWEWPWKSPCLAWEGILSHQSKPGSACSKKHLQKAKISFIGKDKRLQRERENGCTFTFIIKSLELDYLLQVENLWIPLFSERKHTMIEKYPDTAFPF